RKQSRRWSRQKNLIGSSIKIGVLCIPPGQNWGKVLCSRLKERAWQEKDNREGGSTSLVVFILIHKFCGKQNIWQENKDAKNSFSKSGISKFGNLSILGDPIKSVFSFFETSSK